MVHPRKGSSARGRPSSPRVHVGAVVGLHDRRVDGFTLLLERLVPGHLLEATGLGVVDTLAELGRLAARLHGRCLHRRRGPSRTDSGPGRGFCPFGPEGRPRPAGQLRSAFPRAAPARRSAYPQRLAHGGSWKGHGPPQRVISLRGGALTAGSRAATLGKGNALSKSGQPAWAVRIEGGDSCADVADILPFHLLSWWPACWLWGARPQPASRNRIPPAASRAGPASCAWPAKGC